MLSRSGSDKLQYSASGAKALLEMAATDAAGVDRQAPLVESSRPRSPGRRNRKQVARSVGAKQDPENEPYVALLSFIAVKGNKASSYRQESRHVSPALDVKKLETASELSLRRSTRQARPTGPPPVSLDNTELYVLSAIYLLPPAHGSIRLFPPLQLVLLPASQHQQGRSCSIRAR